MRSETLALKSLSIVSTDMASLPIRGEFPEFPEVVQRRNLVKDTEVPR
jgi:hypothetical protein